MAKPSELSAGATTWLRRRTRSFCTRQVGTSAEKRRVCFALWEFFSRESPQRRFMPSFRAGDSFCRTFSSVHSKAV